jgi:AGZA family xanthine/uracil permease-like MFS transporter
LFLAPIFTAIPVHATGVALVAIGIVMVSPIAKLDFSDLTELIPSFLTIVLISFTYNVGVGMTAGLLLYPILKVITGRGREVPPAMWLLALMSMVFYVVYPYH